MKPASLLISGNLASQDRASFVIRARRLEYFTIAWNGFEAVVALASGLLAGSIALVGFGLDSVIETTSAAVLLWSLRTEPNAAIRERRETVAHHMVGGFFLVLAAYVAVRALRALWMRTQPEHSLPGILIAAAAVVVMPLLGRAKRSVARQLGNRALAADSRQADFCAYLSAILLLGLALHWLFGWWWADPVAALVMTPIIAREGIQGVRGKGCDDGGCGS